MNTETPPPTASPNDTGRRVPEGRNAEVSARFRHLPSVIALSEGRRADAWRAFALLFSAGCLVVTYLAIRAGRATDQIHVMDPMGNMYAGPVEPLADSRRFFNVTALYATNCALQRSGAGFDLAELLKLYFSPRAIAKLEEDHKAREKDMRRRSLHWKPVIESVSDPVSAGAARIVEVKGRVIVAGAFAGRTFALQPSFRLVLTFSRNPDLGKSGAYPWICSEIDVRVDDTETSRQ